MRYTPKPKNKKAFVMTVVMLLMGTASFMASTVDIFKGHALLQVIGAAFLALAVYFMMKSITSYTYMVIPINFNGDISNLPHTDAYKPEELAFTVSKRYSKGRESYVCQLDMSSLIAVKDITDTTKKNDVIMHFKPCDVYDYTITIGKTSAYLLVFNKHGYNKTAVICELNDSMLSYFKQVKIMNDTERINGNI